MNGKKMTRKALAAELGVSTKTLERNNELFEAREILASKTGEKFVEYLEENYKDLGLSRKVFITLACIPILDLMEFVNGINELEGKTAMQKYYIKSFISAYSTTKLSIPVSSLQLNVMDEMCEKLGTTRTDMIKNFIDIMTRVYNQNENLSGDNVLKINMQSLVKDRKEKDKCLIKNR